MKLKLGVNPEGVLPETWHASGVIRAVYKRHGFEFVGTSLNDSHADRLASLHNKGLACDVRTRFIPASTMAFIVSDIKELLEPDGYDIVLEKDHLHVEYDPKNSENWIEVVS